MLATKSTWAVIAAACLSGCANNSPFAGSPSGSYSAGPAASAPVSPYAGPKEQAGTAIGAVAGAVVGSQIGGSTGARVAAGVAGAALGGLIGNRIGAALDDEDRQRAYEAQIQALDTGTPGAPVSWRNPDSGRYGTIVPGPAYQQAGSTCRQYTHTIYIEGKPQIARGTACRNADGRWNPVS